MARETQTENFPYLHFSLFFIFFQGKVVSLFSISSDFFVRKISFTSLSHSVYNIQCFVDIFYLHSQLNFLFLPGVFSMFRWNLICLQKRACNSQHCFPSYFAYEFHVLTVFFAIILMLFGREIMLEWEIVILWWKLKANSCTELNIYDLLPQLPSFAFIVFIMIVNVYHLGKWSFLPFRLRFSSRQAKGFSDILSFIYFALSVDNYTHRDGKLLLLNAHI